MPLLNLFYLFLCGVGIFAVVALVFVVVDFVDKR